MRTLVMSAWWVIAIAACEPQSAAPPFARGERDATLSQADGTVAADSGPSASDASQPSAGGALLDVARAALAAWKRSDVTALGQLSPDAATVAQVGADPERMAAMFGPVSWRAAAVAAWDGRFIATRSAGTRALIEFATLADGRVALVDLRQDASGWRFIGIERATLLAYDAFGAEVPQ